MKKITNFKIGLNDESATVTHYLQNLGTKFADTFREDALRLLGFKSEEELLAVLKKKKDNHE
jgi:hypothetical protein